MDTSITYIKNETNVDNSSESVDGISFENKMSVTAAAIDPTVKKVLNNAELQPGEFTFQLFDENNNLIDTRKIQTMVLYSLIPLYLMKLEIIITQLKN